MDALRTGISALSAFDPEVNDNSLEDTIRKGIRLTAMGPTIVAAHHRLRQGLEPIAPNPDLNHAGNFLYMLLDEVPDQETTDILDVDFILHAEHGPNASAFAASNGIYDIGSPFRRHNRCRNSKRSRTRRRSGRGHEDGLGHWQPRECCRVR